MRTARPMAGATRYVRRRGPPPGRREQRPVGCAIRCRRLHHRVGRGRIRPSRHRRVPSCPARRRHDSLSSGRGRPERAGRALRARHPAAGHGEPALTGEAAGRRGRDRRRTVAARMSGQARHGRRRTAAPTARGGRRHLADTVPRPSRRSGPDGDPDGERGRRAGSRSDRDVRARCGGGLGVRHPAQQVLNQPILGITNQTDPFHTYARAIGVE